MRDISPQCLTGNGRCRTSQVGRDWATLSFRSFATSKADAFAGPLGFVPIEFFHGNNNLSLLEMALAAAYRKLERPDLASFVERGKLYQRLDSLLHGMFPSWGKIKALRACIDDPQEHWPTTSYGDWKRYLNEKYKADEGVLRLVAAERARREARSTVWIARPNCND